MRTARLMVRPLSALILISVLANGVQADSGSVRSAAELIESADIVVIARISGSPTVISEEGFLTHDNWVASAADLSVQECFKGGVASGTTLRVPVSPDFTCPPPPHFPRGETVLAFLNKLPSGELRPCGGSWGVRQLSSQLDMSCWSERIREYLLLPQPRTSAETSTRLIEWLVRCAEGRSTRFDGARGLERVLRNQANGSFAAGALSLEQRRRLYHALLHSGTLGQFGDTQLAEVCILLGDRASIDHVLRAIECRYSADGRYIVDELSYSIAHSSGWRGGPEAFGEVSRARSTVIAKAAPSRGGPALQDYYGVIRKFVSQARAEIPALH